MAVWNEPDKAAAEDEHRPVVMLDGAYIRAAPGHQVRNFEAICGKVEHEGHSTRRFALVRSVTEQPRALLRAALQDQGWRESDLATVISDGDPTLPALVRSATGGPAEYVLGWFHLSMRVHHVEQVMGGLCAVEPPLLAPLGHAQADMELRSYIENNKGALIDYGERYRAGKPISTSRAEGTVNQLVNARMNKRRQMRWSPRAVHCVLQVGAALLDGRFGHQSIQLAA